MGRRSLVALATLLLTASTLADVRIAHAASCRAIDGGSPALVDIDATERLRFIRRTLHRAAHRGKIWAWTWGTTYGAITVGQLAAMPAFPKDEWPDWYLGAAGAAVGVVAMVALPPKAIRDAPWLERRIALAPPDADPCALLTDAERLLERDAAGEALGTSWIAHAGNVAINAALAAGLALGFQRYQSAAISAGAGLLVGEVEILTQPKDAMHGLERYRRGELDDSSPRERTPSLSVAPLVVPQGGGLSLTLTHF